MNNTRGRVAAGKVVHCFWAPLNSARVVGQMSGQWVKPMNTTVQWPRSSSPVSAVPSDCCSEKAGSTRGVGSRVMLLTAGNDEAVVPRPNHPSAAHSPPAVASPVMINSSNVRFDMVIRNK